MNGQTKTILLLEDDESLNRGISLKLQKEGYEVLSAFSIGEAERLFDARPADMVICDVNLPDGNGMDFGAFVRRQSEAYVLFLTARDSEINMINAYDLGADDYITKPFSLAVLISKVHAFMRRASRTAKRRIRSGRITFSYGEMKAYKTDGEPLLLSKKELQLLVYFMENPRQILSKEQILEQVWDVDGQFVDENTVPVNISRLKTKISEDYIQNVRGFGYIWTEESMRE